MGVLNIRNLPDEVHQALRERAARNGRSMEAEAREILSEVCRPSAQLDALGLQEFVKQAFAGNRPSGVVDRFLGDRQSEWAED